MTLPLPPGYQPPGRPPLFAAVRTMQVVATEIVPIAASMFWGVASDFGSSTSEAGLRSARQRYLRILQKLGCELEVIGAERVPADGGVTFLWNQASHLDHLVIPVAMPRPFFCLFNNELGAFPFYGSYLRRSGHVHVDRTDPAQWRPAIAAAARRVEQGECVLVSPEGTRNWDGKLLPLKQGALQLASAADRPVVCACVVGGHERLPRGSAVVRPGRVVVELSHPLSVGERTPRGRRELADRVSAVFQQALDTHGPGCAGGARS